MKKFLNICFIVASLNAMTGTGFNLKEKMTEISTECYQQYSIPKQINCSGYINARNIGRPYMERNQQPTRNQLTCDNYLLCVKKKIAELRLSDTIKAKLNSLVYTNDLSRNDNYIGTLGSGQKTNLPDHLGNYSRAAKAKITLCSSMCKAHYDYLETFIDSNGNIRRDDVANNAFNDYTICCRQARRIMGLDK